MFYVMYTSWLYYGPGMYSWNPYGIFLAPINLKILEQNKTYQSFFHSQKKTLSTISNL